MLDRIAWFYYAAACLHPQPAPRISPPPSAFRARFFPLRLKRARKYDKLFVFSLNLPSLLSATILSNLVKQSNRHHIVKFFRLKSGRTQPTLQAVKPNPPSVRGRIQPARRAVERNPPAERSNATRPPSDRTPLVQFTRNSLRSISRKSLHSFFKMKLSSARLNSRSPPSSIQRSLLLAHPSSARPPAHSPAHTLPTLPGYALVYLKWKQTNCCGPASYYTTTPPFRRY